MNIQNLIVFLNVSKKYCVVFKELNKKFGYANEGMQPAG